MGELKSSPFFSNNAMDEQIYEWCRLAHVAQNSSLLHKYSRTIIDSCIRGASNIETCGSTSVHCNTSSILQWGRWWSESALQHYNAVREQLTVTRKGKPPTHLQITNYRENGKRPWTVEHRYPLNIIKQRVYAGASVEEIYTWIKAYGVAVIILHTENATLQSYTKTEKEAQDRYQNITILQHPNFKDIT